MGRRSRAAAAAFHRAHRNGSAGAECGSSAADEVDISDTIEFLVVGHPGLAIAEANFRPQIEIDVGPAVGRFALKGPSPSKLVDGERPCGFGPDRRMRTVRRPCRGEDRIAANPSGKHDGGDGGDLLAHNPGCFFLSNAPVPTDLHTRADGTVTRSPSKLHHLRAAVRIAAEQPSARLPSYSGSP
jgi:hypothetical protein